MSLNAPEPSASTALRLLVAGTFFMQILDGTVITPAIPAMAASFGCEPVSLSIGVSAYLLAVGAFIPISGWAADRFGARRVFSLAILLFTLASGLCALAPGLISFTALRVIQGIGGAMMVPVGRLIVLRNTPKDQLIHAIAMLTWPALLAPVLGPPLGGWIALNADWRWIFYLNLPLGMLALALAIRWVPNEKSEKASPLDWKGFLLTGIGMACSLWAVEMPAHGFGFGTAFWISAVCGLTSLTLGIRHLRKTPAPLLKLDAVKIPTFAVTIFGGSLFRFGISSVPFLVPLMFQLGFGWDAFRSGMTLMAVFIGNLVIKPFTTPILKRFGFRTTLLGNGMLNVGFIAACATFQPDSSLLYVLVVLGLGGMSRSLQFTALNTLAFAEVPKESMSSANTLFSTMVQFAMGVGISIGALGIRMGHQVAEVTSGEALTAYHFALVFVAVIAAFGCLDTYKLPANAGAVVLQPKSH